MHSYRILRTRQIASASYWRVPALLSLCALLAAGPALGATESTSAAKTLVTDRSELARLGFPPEAVVYAWYPVSTSAELVDERATVGSRAPGGGPRRYHAMSGRMFQERETGAFERGLSAGGGEICCLAATDPFVDVDLQLPQQADLEYIDIWGKDVCAEDLEVFLFRSCLPLLSPGTPTLDLLGSVTTSDTEGDFIKWISVPGIMAVDNTLCHYWVRARFGDGTAACNCGSALTLHKVRAQFTYPNEGAVALIGEQLP